MTATQPDSDRGLTRRGVMRRTAIGIGAMATLGGAASTGAAAITWDQVGKIAAANLVGGPAAAAVVAYGMTVDGPDEEAVADSITWQSYVNEYTRAREDNLLVDQTTDSLGRDVQLVGNKAREEAIFRIYEQGIGSGTEAEATTAAENAIDDAYTTVERSIFTSWNIRANRADSFFTNFTSWEDNPNGSLQDTNYLSLDQSNPDRSGSTSTGSTTADVTDWGTTTHTLLDGNTLSVAYNYNDDSTYSVILNLDPTRNPSNLDNRDGYGDTVIVPKPDPADFSTADEPLDVSYDQVAVINSWTWRKLLNNLYTEHSNMMGEVSALVSTYFQPAQDGEVDLFETMGPKSLTDTAKNASDYQEATMALRGMGFSIADQTSVVSFKQDGETYELDGRLARTVQDPNDLPVGSELDPSSIPGSVYGAFNIQNDAGEQTGEIFEISNPFTIETAEGNTALSFQSRELVGTDSSLTNAEIQAIFSENFDANTDAEENTYDTALTDGGGGGSGGGGGFLSGDRNWGLIAGGTGALALGWGYLTGEDN